MAELFVKNAIKRKHMDIKIKIKRKTYGKSIKGFCSRYYSSVDIRRSYAS